MPMLDNIDFMTIGPSTFIGGRNAEWSKDMSLKEAGGGVTPDQCIELDNFDIFSAGPAIGRKGTHKLNSTALVNSGRVRSMYFYYKASTSTKYFLVQCGNEIGKVSLVDGAWTKLATLTTTEPLKWITWNDNAYAFNGTGIHKFDGTTWSNVQTVDADAPDSTDGCILQDVLFTARDTSTYPSRVPFSDAFDAETWSATDYRRVREGDGQQIIGIDVLYNRIIARRTRSIVWLHGSSIYDFAEEWLSEEVGQVGRMTGTPIAESALMFQSNRGIEYFDPNKPIALNNIVRDTCMTEILGISRTNREAACAIYHPKTNRYLISYPDEATPLIYVFYLSIPRQSPDGAVWFPHAVYKDLTVTAFAVDSTVGSEGKLYFGTKTGYVLEADYGYTDDGAEIAGKIKWGYTDCGIPNQVKGVSRVYVPARARGSLQITTDIDFGKVNKTKFTSSYSDPDSGIWDTSHFDAATWAGELIATRHARFLKCKGVRVAIQIQKNFVSKTEIHPFVIEFFPVEKLRWP